MITNDDKEEIRYIKILTGGKDYVEEQLRIIRTNHKVVEIEPIGYDNGNVALIVKVMDFDLKDTDYDTLSI